MPIPNLLQIIASPLRIGGTELESAVGRAWLLKHGDEWDRVEFNVGLGPGIDLGPGYADYVQKAATASTKPRADMIVFRDGSAAIVELKGRIGPSALGQLLTYWHMLQADNPKLLQVYKIVAGQTIQEGLQKVWENYGIIVELFSVPDVTPIAAK